MKCNGIRSLGLLVNRRGVALTEFVATLPVFVTVFVAISTLAPMLSDGTTAAAAANQDMWMQAIPISQGNEPSRGAVWTVGGGSSEWMHLLSPAGGGQTIAATFGYTGENRGGEPAWLADKAGGGLLVTHGDLGEFFTRLKLVQLFGPKDLPDSFELNPRFLVGGTKIGAKLYPNGGLKKEVLYRLLSELYMGNRYGLVLGHVDKQQKAGRFNYRVARYSTALVAPEGNPGVIENFKNLFTRSPSFANVGKALSSFGHPWFLIVNPYFTGTDSYKGILGMESQNNVKRINVNVPDPFGPRSYGWGGGRTF